MASSTRPIITIGSGAEYDKSKPLIKVKEEDFGKNIPKDPYGYPKYMISKEIEKRDNILNLRVFGIYGKGEDPSRLISFIVNSNIKKEPIILNQNAKFDFLFVDDLCKIVEYFMRNSSSKRFINVTPTESIFLCEIGEIINKISDFKSEIIVKNSRINYIYTGNNKLLMNELGGFEYTSYENGIKKLFENY